MNLIGSKNFFIALSLAVLVSFGSPTEISAQYATFQYRHVSPENMQEFVHLETTYWKAIADKAIDDGKMLWWGMYQKVGGWNLSEGSNFLFINVFADKTAFDGSMGEIWDPTGMFPEVSPDYINSSRVSSTNHQIFVMSLESAGKEQTPQFLKINYGKIHDSERTQEIEMSWKPFIEEQIANGTTGVINWRLVQVLSPTGASIPFDYMTLDGFDKLSEALHTTWAEGVEFPDMEGFADAATRDRVSIFGLVAEATGSQNE